MEEKKVTLTAEAMSKIGELADRYSANFEDSEKLRGSLQDILQVIVSFCCFGRFGGENMLLARNTDLVQINVVSNGKDMSVTIKKGGDETKGFLKCEEIFGENFQKEIEERFLLMLEQGMVFGRERTNK